jgi:hypothetical protein
MRTESFFQFVLREALKINHYFRRYEFAKSRGTIHFHSLLWLLACCVVLRRIFAEVFSATNMERLEEIENEIAYDLKFAFGLQFLTLTAEHPAGRKRTWSQAFNTQQEQDQDPTITAQSPPKTSWYLQRTDDEGKKSMVRGDEDVPISEVGNIDQWVKPEGLIDELTTTPLRKTHTEISSSEKKNDSIKLTNICGLHQCSSYCLVVRNGVIVCRLEYGIENPAVVLFSD